MNRRLRKKRRRGEFREYGFRLSWKLDPPVTDWRDPRVDAFFDKLVEQLESLELRGGGTIDDLFVCRCRDTCTEDDLRAMSAWLSDQGLGYYSVGPLIDAWWGDFENWTGTKGFIDEAAKMPRGKPWGTEAIAWTGEGVELPKNFWPDGSARR